MDRRTAHSFQTQDASLWIVMKISWPGFNDQRQDFLDIGIEESIFFNGGYIPRHDRSYFSRIYAWA
jgi:hypothetical protein